MAQFTGASWPPAPAAAFVDPEDPNNLILGLGHRSDGMWAPIGINFADLRFIMHVTAPLGYGKAEWIKSSLLEGLLRAGAGFLALDCKGTDLVNTTLPLIPLDREADVTIFDVGGTKLTGQALHTSMNLFSPAFGRSLNIRPAQWASILSSVFTSIEPRFNQEAVKRATTMGVLALLEGEPQATMMHLVRFFGDEDYRADVLGRVTTAQVREFWEMQFPALDSAERAYLVSLERNLCRLLALPKLSAMLVAPGCSIDIRRMMDNRGILLAGIRAADSQVASVIGTLLLTQVALAALSRSNVPETQRPDWPCIIDEAQVVFGNNPGLARIMFSQFRGLRIGQVVVHQNLDQLSNLLPVLAGNAQNRVILGAEPADAVQYGRDYAAVGLTEDDFVNVLRFEQQYIRLHGAGNLFAARTNGLVKPLEEDAPPLCETNWKTVTASATSSQDTAMDAMISELRELARARRDEAVQRLGRLYMRDPAAFDAYCARTRAHRLAQREFIIDNPGCIQLGPKLQSEPALLRQKEQRIRILSALGSGVPRLETEALAWALLMSAREAGEARGAPL